MRWHASILGALMVLVSGPYVPAGQSSSAVSQDRMRATDLIQPSEPYDTPFAHKPWLIKHDGVVYHFYCAVGGAKGEHRAIAVATSKDLK